MSLKKALKIACMDRGITQKELASRAAMTESYLSNIFSKGEMSVRNLQKVCTALDLKVWEFCKLGDV